MAQTYYQAFSITGVTNDTTYDGGLTSTEAEPKRLKAILVNVSDYQDNLVQVWLEREKLADVYDKIFNTDGDTGSTNTPYSTTKLIRLPVDRDIPVGQTAKVAIQCGGNATNIQGAYEYEITA